MPARLIRRTTTTTTRSDAARVSVPLGVDVQRAEDLPDDVDVLRQTVMHLLESINGLARVNARLEERLAYLLRRRYGPQSEKLDAAQLELFSEEIRAMLQQEADAEMDEPDEPVKKPGPRRQPTGRRRIPGHLPRIERRHALDADMRSCPTCGTDRVVIGTKTSEQLEIVPARLVVIRHVAETYACATCAGEIETATKPGGAIARCLAGPGLLAHIIVNKFDDHLPLYRQEEILKRNGIDVARSTMCGWLLGCAAALEPLHELMHRKVLQSRIVQTDGSSMPLQEKGRGSTRSAGFWVYRGDDRAPYVTYDFTVNQDRAGPRKWLRGFHGTLQADASSLYDVFFDEQAFGTRVEEAGCWAHARRNFEKAKMQHPAEALTALAWIAKLYAVEAETKRISHRRRRRVRRQRARAILTAFREWIDARGRQALPKSPLGRAIAYVQRHWAALTRYVDNGRIAIDNNASERAIRPMTVGRKNWLFAGSTEGGRATALFFTMVESAKRAGVDATTWLADVLGRVNDTPAHELGDLLPDRWKLLAENRAVRQVRAAAARRAEHALINRNRD